MYPDNNEQVDTTDMTKHSDMKSTNDEDYNMKKRAQSSINS